MFIASLMGLIIATVTAWVSFNTEEEVVQTALGLVSLLSVLLALFFAPWIIKILVVGIALLVERIKYSSASKSF